MIAALFGLVAAWWIHYGSFPEEYISPQLNFSVPPLVEAKNNKAISDHGEQKCGEGSNGVIVLDDENGHASSISCKQVAETSDLLWRGLLIVCVGWLLWRIHTGLKRP